MLAKCQLSHMGKKKKLEKITKSPGHRAAWKLFHTVVGEDHKAHKHFQQNH